MGSVCNAARPIRTANFAIPQNANCALMAIGCQLIVASVNPVAPGMSTVAYARHKNVRCVSRAILFRMGNAFHVARSMPTAACVILILAAHVMTDIIHKAFDVYHVKVVLILRVTVISAWAHTHAQSVRRVIM